MYTALSGLISQIVQLIAFTLITSSVRSLVCTISRRTLMAAGSLLSAGRACITAPLVHQRPKNSAGQWIPAYPCTLILSRPPPTSSPSPPSLAPPPPTSSPHFPNSAGQWTTAYPCTLFPLSLLSLPLLPLLLSFLLPHPLPILLPPPSPFFFFLNYNC